jgi:hypothetical protein
MFYQPDRKMTLVVLTNFYGADPYAIGRALYAALPGFLCGNANKKESKIEVCFNGNTICVDRSAAPGLIQQGAYLGPCVQSVNKSGNISAVSASNSQSTTTINAYPNPFVSHVTLSFKVPQQGLVNLSVYDINGKLVSTLLNSVSGKDVLHTVDFDGSRLSSGVYMCRLQTGTSVTQQKLVLRK